MKNKIFYQKLFDCHIIFLFFYYFVKFLFIYIKSGPGLVSEGRLQVIASRCFTWGKVY